MVFPRNEFLEKAREEGRSNEYIAAVFSYVSNLERYSLPIIFDSYHLAYWIQNDYYTLKSICTLSNNYYEFYCIKKRTGGYRRIIAPHPNLKEIQKWILTNVLNNLTLPEYVTAFQSGSSIVKNAKIHENKSFILKLDLKNFFESISTKRIYGFFVKLGYGKQLAYDLAKLCSTTVNQNKIATLPPDKLHSFDFLKNKFDGFLPQGAPTSPTLANLIAHKIDIRLKSYADHHGINYSRYADDITFSSDYKESLPKINFIKKVIIEEGFELNMDKVFYIDSSQHPKVTGLLLENHVHISCKYKRNVQRHLYFCKRYGARNHFEFFAPDIKNAQMWLLGRIRFIYQVEPEVGKNMLKEFDEINWL